MVVPKDYWVGLHEFRDALRDIMSVARNGRWKKGCKHCIIATDGEVSSSSLNCIMETLLVYGLPLGTEPLKAGKRRRVRGCHEKRDRDFES